MLKPAKKAYIQQKAINAVNNINVVIKSDKSYLETFVVYLIFMCIKKYHYKQF